MLRSGLQHKDQEVPAIQEADTPSFHQPRKILLEQWTSIFHLHSLFAFAFVFHTTIFPQIVYLRGGEKPPEVSVTVSYGRYTWTKKSPYRLPGLLSNVGYRTLKQALKVRYFVNFHPLLDGVSMN